MGEPFRFDRRGGVLYATLDTPRCAVNVLDRRAATQLLDGLRHVDPSSDRALVLRSGKPGSFVNGGRLLLSATMRDPERLAEQSESIRAALEALRACPIPTVAAIEGACYGAGVELALQCRVRVARRGRDTRFRVGDVADYRCVPSLGATWDLPATVGFASAARLIVRGETWWGAEALRRGLVDALVPDFDDDRWLAGALDVAARPRTPRGWTRTDQLAWRRETDRVAALPEDDRPAHAVALALCRRAARGVPRDVALAVEGRAAVETTLSATAREALSFFFVRQAADGQARRAAQTAKATRLHARADRPEAMALAALVRSSGLAGVDVRVVGSGPDLRIGDDVGEVAVGLGGLDLIDVPEGLDAWIAAPLGGDGPIAQVVAREPRARVLVYDLLRRVGIEAFPTAAPVALLRTFLAADLGPSAWFVLAGGRPADALAARRAFGIAAHPGRWLARVGPFTLARALADDEATAVRLGIALDRLAVADPSRGDAEAGGPAMAATEAAWADAVAEARDAGVHPATIDLLARELLDFPLSRSTLCRHLDRRRRPLPSEDETPFWVT